MQHRVVPRAGRDILGEGPVWDSVRGELLWVDIVGQRLHRLDLTGGGIASLDLTEPIGWALPRCTATSFIAGFRSGFHILDVDTGERQLIGHPEADRPFNRLNDAKVDPQGRIWAGSKHDLDDSATGALHRLDPSMTWRLCDDGYGVANGPAFSPDGRTMYHTDSALRTIYAFDLHDDGTLSGKRIWRRFDDDWGYPDGMTTDADGCLWIAHWGGGRISRFAADGALVGSICLPATNITSCAFAGERLDRLFVTSSTLDREDEPYAGALFEVDTGCIGLPPHRFAG